MADIFTLALFLSLCLSFQLFTFCRSCFDDDLIEVQSDSSSICNHNYLFGVVIFFHSHTVRHFQLFSIGFFKAFLPSFFFLSWRTLHKAFNNVLSYFLNEMNREVRRQDAVCCEYINFFSFPFCLMPQKSVQRAIMELAVLFMGREENTS